MYEEDELRTFIITEYEKINFHLRNDSKMAEDFC